MYTPPSLLCWTNGGPHPVALHNPTSNQFTKFPVALILPFLQKQLPQYLEWFPHPHLKTTTLCVMTILLANGWAESMTVQCLVLIMKKAAIWDSFILFYIYLYCVHACIWVIFVYLLHAQKLMKVGQYWLHIYSILTSHIICYFWRHLKMYLKIFFSRWQIKVQKV